mmetsp:Transcript_39300/g.86254  ORF Transcript_39300/g.86254 Transcript_39300/m.86254 type:complete len:389 (-) Transcript_39300:467-1633(-)
MRVVVAGVAGIPTWSHGHAGPSGAGGEHHAGGAKVRPGRVEGDGTHGDGVGVHAGGVGDGRVVGDGLSVGTQSATRTSADGDRYALALEAHHLYPLASDAISLVLARLGLHGNVEGGPLALGAALLGLGEDALDLLLLLDGPIAGALVLAAAAILEDLQHLEIILGAGVLGLLLDLGDALPEAGGPGTGLGVLARLALDDLLHRLLLAGFGGRALLLRGALLPARHGGGRGGVGVAVVAVGGRVVPHVGRGLAVHGGIARRGRAAVLSGRGVGVRHGAGRRSPPGRRGRVLPLPPAGRPGISRRRVGIRHCAGGWTPSALLGRSVSPFSASAGTGGLFLATAGSGCFLLLFAGVLRLLADIGGFFVVCLHRYSTRPITVSLSLERVPS